MPDPSDIPSGNPPEATPATRTNTAGGRFTFKLTYRVNLGKPIGFIRWVNEKLHAGIPEDLQKEAPPALKEPIAGFLDMDLWIDRLEIDAGSERSFVFEASADFTTQKPKSGSEAPKVGGVFELQKIGFHVSSGSKGS